MKKIVLFIVSAAICVGLVQMLFGRDDSMPLETVEYVDLEQFMGDWYVIANIPTIFEKGAVNAIETYTWNPKGYVDVTFTYNKNEPQGKLKSMTQKGFIYDETSNAEWRIQPIWPLKFGYLILDVADDYSYTVIGVPSRKYVWIMARQNTMDGDVYQGILERLKVQGYNTDLIKDVPQVW